MQEYENRRRPKFSTNPIDDVVACVRSLAAPGQPVRIKHVADQLKLSERGATYWLRAAQRENLLSYVSRQQG